MEPVTSSHLFTVAVNPVHSTHPFGVLFCARFISRRAGHKAQATLSYVHFTRAAKWHTKQ